MLFTVADLFKTWVSETRSVSTYGIHKWLDLTVCGTLSNVFLPNNKFGLNVCLPSVKFTQCQTVQRKALKSSLNEEIKYFWSSTSVHINIQYDAFKSTKDVVKKFQADQENKYHGLLSQGFFFKHVKNDSSPELNKIWSSVQLKSPRTYIIFNPLHQQPAAKMEKPYEMVHIVIC